MGEAAVVSLRGLTQATPREPIGWSDMRVWAHKSTALSAAHFMLAMRAEGYDTCPMEGMDSRRVKNCWVCHVVLRSAWWCLQERERPKESMVSVSVLHGRHSITFADHIGSFDSFKFKSVQKDSFISRKVAYVRFIRNICAQPRRGAPEPKVRLTMTCPKAGHFFAPIRDV